MKREDMVSFVNNFFDVTNFDSLVNESSLSEQVTSDQSREEEAQDASTSIVSDSPGQSKDAYLKTANDPPKNISPFELHENPEFSDEESDNGCNYMIAKLIEESFPENDDLLGNSKKRVEKLYNSNTSVLQEPPSPTSKMNAKKCLSFRDVAAVARKNDNTDKTLSKLSHSMDQFQLQESLNLSNENPKPTDTKSDVWTVNSERMSKDSNSRRISFLDALFNNSAFEHVGNKSSVVHKTPPVSFTAITDEEFHLEGMSSENKSFLIPLPVKARSTQKAYVNKGEKTALEMANSKSERKKCSERKEPRSSKKAIKKFVQEVAPSRTGEAVEPGPETKDAGTQQVLEQFEKPMASSQDADLPHIVEEEEDGYEDMLLVENQDDNDSQHGKDKAKSTKPAQKTKKSKLSEKKLKHQVRERKTKNVVIKTPLYSQSQIGRLKIDHRDKQTAETVEDLLPRKSKTRIKHISTPYHAEHRNKESVFQSEPVIRQRTLLSTAAIKPVACDLDSLESEGLEKHVSYEIDNDAAFNIFSSGLEAEAEEQHNSPEDHKSIVYSEKHKELFEHYLIVFDPDTQSDVLVDCISQGEKSEFFCDDACTSWYSFNNSLFNTGKLIIAPKKFTTIRISMSVMIYYIEQGQVRLNLHKSERILKAGDFFFVPPAPAAPEPQRESPAAPEPQQQSSTGSPASLRDISAASSYAGDARGSGWSISSSSPEQTENQIPTLHDLLASQRRLSEEIHQHGVMLARFVAAQERRGSQ
ncbi:centromere protein C isoform X2 [Phyllobates terribilis]